MKKILNSVGNNFLWITVSLTLLLLMSILTTIIYFIIVKNGFTAADLEFLKAYSLLISIGTIICVIILIFNFYTAGKNLKTID